MAKKKFKLDTAKIKQFLITHGERVALGAAAVLMVWLVLSGMATALLSTSVYPEIEKAAKNLDNRIRNSHPTGEFAIVTEPTAPSWDDLASLEEFSGWTWFNPGAAGESKLSNPSVLDIPVLVRKRDKNGKETNDKVSGFQVDIVQAPFFNYDLDNTRRKVWVLKTKSDMKDLTKAPLAQYVNSRQMVVVSAAFPYAQQLELIRKALRKPTVEALFADDKTRPDWIGLDVVRYELDQNGKQVRATETHLFKAGAGDKKVMPQRKLDQFLVLAKFDGDNYLQLAKHLLSGMATPVPTLAQGEYPPIKLPGINQAKSTKTKKDDMGGPMGGGGPAPGAGDGGGAPAGGGDKGGGFPGAPDGGGMGAGGTMAQLEIVKLAKKDPVLADRLRGKYDPFDPLGRLDPYKDKKWDAGGPKEGGGPAGGPASGGTGEGGEGGPASGGTGSGVPDPGDAGDSSVKTPAGIPDVALLRFIDIDVEPGKSYVYWIRPRLANPNYGMYKQVMYKKLAEYKELTSPKWTPTPTVKIPDDVEYYVVDQKKLDKTSRGPNYNVGTDKNRVAVQVHRWVNEYRFYGEDTQKPKQSGEWTIARRLIVHRGDYLGETKVEVPVPGWNPTKNAFVAVKDPNLKKQPRTTRSGLSQIYMDFLPGGTGPAMVDFKGGRRYTQGIGGEESALKMLVLTADGKLRLHTDRVDADPNSPRGARREQRYDAWINRLKSLSNDDEKKKAGGFPGNPGGGG